MPYAPWNLDFLKTASTYPYPALIETYLRVLARDEQKDGRRFSSWQIAKDYLMLNATSATRAVSRRFLKECNAAQKELFADILCAGGDAEAVGLVAGMHETDKERLWAYMKKALAIPIKDMPGTSGDVAGGTPMNDHARILHLIQRGGEGDHESINELRCLLKSRLHADFILSMINEKPVPELDADVGALLADPMLRGPAGRYLIIRNSASSYRVLSAWSRKREANTVEPSFWNAYFPDLVANPDSDRDGLSDDIEDLLGSDPQAMDTDADELADGDDLDPLVSFRGDSKIAHAQIMEPVLIRNLGFQEPDGVLHRLLGMPDARFPMPYYGGLVVHNQKAMDYFRKRTSDPRALFATIQISSSEVTQDRARISYGWQSDGNSSSCKFLMSNQDGHWLAEKALECYAGW